LLAFNPLAQHALDALDQVMAVRQQEIRQAGASLPAHLALPALDPQRIGPPLVFRLAMIVPMPDQAVLRLACRAVTRARTLSLFFLVAIRLRIRSKIGYNGGGLSGYGGLLARRWLLAGRPFFLAMFAESYRIIWTRKAALFGAACFILAYRGSIYFRLKALYPTI